MHTQQTEKTVTTIPPCEVCGGILSHKDGCKYTGRRVGSASVDTTRAITQRDKRQFSLIIKGKPVIRLLAKDHHCAARQARKHFWPKGESTFNFTISPINAENTRKEQMSAK